MASLPSNLTVTATIDGVEYTLVWNAATERYEKVATAPAITSYNVNPGHYYPVEIHIEDEAGFSVDVDDTDPTFGENCKLYVKEITPPQIVIDALSEITDEAIVSTGPLDFIVNITEEVNGSGLDMATMSLALTPEGGAQVIYGVGDPEISVDNIANGKKITLTRSYPDAPYIITVDIDDYDTNSASQFGINFWADTEAPDLSVSEPLEGSYVKTTSVHVIGYTNDGSNAVILTIQLDSNVPLLVPVDQDGTFDYDLDLETEGPHTIIILAEDIAARQSSITRNIIRDTIPPRILNINLVPQQTQTGLTYDLEVECDDNGTL